MIPTHKKISCFLICIIATTAQAFTTPSVTVSTTIGNQNPWTGDIWWPINTDNTNYFFTDLAGGYSPTDYTRQANTGLVYRRKTKNDWAWGIYGYGSYNRSLLGQTFWTFNPGIELLNANWHFSWNTYLPMSPSHQASNSYVWADEVGIYDYMRFQGHDQFNQLVQATSTTGTGTDIIIGYRFQRLENLQLSVGSYYFNMPHHPIGEVAMIETPTWNHLSYSTSFTHDPLTHNSVNLEIKVHFGETKTVQNDWINTPTQHNLAASDQANTIPIVTGYRTQGTELLQKDNVWFFDPNAPAFNSAAGLENCTYEHPCSGLNSTTAQDIATIAPNGNFQYDPSFYLKPGDYVSDAMILYGNESIIGRSSNYVRPAEGEQRPILFTDEVLIDRNNNNSNNTLANLYLFNNNGDFPAIKINNTQNTWIDNLVIGGFVTDFPFLNYAIGIDINNSQNVSIENTTINTNNFLAGSTEPVYDIIANTVQNLSIQNSHFYGYAGEDHNQGVGGLLVTGDSTINIDNSSFAQDASGINSRAINFVTTSGASANVTINNSQFTSNAAGDGSSAQNIQLGSNSRGNINQSSFNADVHSTGTNSTAAGIELYDHAELTMANSSVHSTGESTSGRSSATNFFLYDDSRLNLINTNLFASGQSALVTGSTNITAEDNSVANVTGGILETDMAGGPSSGEPSGAVSLWSLDNAAIHVTDATVTAKSNNNQTIATVLQAQDNSAIDITNSHLNIEQLNGNTTPNASPGIVAGGTSTINISNSIINDTVEGAATEGAELLLSIGNSTIHVTNNQLTLDNQSTGTGLETIGAVAANNGTIYLTNNVLSLTGPNIQTSKIFGGGQVIISDGHASDIDHTLS